MYSPFVCENNSNFIWLYVARLLSVVAGKSIFEFETISLAWTGQFPYLQRAGAQRVND